MAAPFDPSVEVLSGEHRDLRWRVVASGGAAELMTTLQVFKSGRLVKDSGFGGPPLYPGEVVNEWRGRSEGIPYFVVARVHPSIDRVVAVTDRNTEVILNLSPTVEQFGLRFAAAVLPDGEAPGAIRAECNGEVVTGLPTPGSPLSEPGPAHGSGWISSAANE